MYTYVQGLPATHYKAAASTRDYWMNNAMQTQNVVKFLSLEILNKTSVNSDKEK